MSRWETGRIGLAWLLLLSMDVTVLGHPTNLVYWGAALVGWPLTITVIRRRRRTYRDH